MFLKHLLNEDDIESYPAPATRLRWDDSTDSGFYDEYVPETIAVSFC